MTPVKIIALVFVIAALAKVLVICVNPISWKGVIRKFYSNPIYTTVFSLVAAAVILRYLLQELTIVQVFASMTFMMALMMVQFAAFGNEIIEMSDKYFNDKNMIKKAWLSLFIWIILMVWVLYRVFV